MRLLRTARVQLMSREIGDHVYHPAGAHAALLSAMMRAKSDADWYDTLGWLYGGKALSSGTDNPAPTS